MGLQDTYNQCLEEMFALGRFGIVLGLETMEGLLRAAGNPEAGLSVIHIAGTNGKGSVAAYLASALEAAGHRTGVYTSPHLVRVNERFCVSGLPVSDEEIVESYLTVKKSPGLPRQPTFFEVTTAMAMDIFAKRGVTWAVVEAGMGGRLDATNILKPRLSVITNISLEHQMYLGNTVAKIAGEKAGIIKPGVPAATGVRQKTALAALETKAREQGAPMAALGRDFSVSRERGGAFTYKGLDTTLPGLRVALAGAHQHQNAAVALAGLELLKRQGVDTGTEAALRAALLAVRWPGRLETVSESPRVILDGAHNLGAMRWLVKHLKKHAPRERLVIVCGILDDKPYAEMMNALLPCARLAVLCQPKTGRATPLETLAQHARGLGVETRAVPDVAEALAEAAGLAGPEGTVCVCGSLYVVGEAREALMRQGLPLTTAVFLPVKCNLSGNLPR
jgi:dihydrofolate synthase/folylpolyglutamate synthase